MVITLIFFVGAFMFGIGVAVGLAMAISTGQDGLNELVRESEKKIL